VRICIYKSNSLRNICLLYFLIIADSGSSHRLWRFKDPQANCYRCDVCFKCFTRRDHLRTHKKNLHGEDAGPFACIVCSQLYKNVDSLRKHIAKFHVMRAKPTDKTKLIWCCIITGLGFWNLFGTCNAEVSELLLACGLFWGLVCMLVLHIYTFFRYNYASRLILNFMMPFIFGDILQSLWW